MSLLRLRAAAGGGGAAIQSVAPATTGGAAGQGWTGDPNSGYDFGVAPVTPTTSVGRTATRPMPTAHFLTVQQQSFCTDFIVHVIAKAPNGIASVEFFHENPTTTTVTSTQHSTIINGTLPSNIAYDTFAIKMPASAWCNDATKGGGLKQGATLYAKVTANPVAGVTLFPRIIGPLTLCPRFPVSRAAPYDGLPNDKLVLISSNGLYDDGTPVVAPANATLVNTLAQAEALIGTSGGNGVGSSTGAYNGAFNPLVMFVKSGTYDVVNQRDWGVLPTSPNYAWWTLTHAAGVTVTLHRSTAPSYDRRMTNDATNGDVTHWAWVPTRGMMEIRGSGITLDHTNFGHIQTDTSPEGWDNHCKHTLGSGVSAVADTVSAQANLGVTSKLYNFYWNGGPHAAGYTASNATDGAAGRVSTCATYEYIGYGPGAALPENIVLESTYYQTPGNPAGGNQRITVGTYCSGQVTGLLNPGTPAIFTMIGPVGSTFSFTANTNSTHKPDDPVLTLTDSNGSQTITCGFGPSDNDATHAHTIAQAVALVSARAGWTASAGAGASLGWAFRWCAPETAIVNMPAHDTVHWNGTTWVVDVPGGGYTHVAKQPTHTEYDHITGYFTVGGVARIDNILFFCCVVRMPVHWGSATFQAENTGTSNIDRADNSWFVNNYFEDEGNGDMNAMTGGSFTTVANNTHLIFEAYNNGATATDGSQWKLNISTKFSGAITAVTAGLGCNLVPAASGMNAFDSTSVDLSSGQISALFVNQSIGDIRAGASSVISAHQAISPEAYDLLGNLRDPTGDYPGALSKNSQAAAPVWPF